MTKDLTETTDEPRVDDRMVADIARSMLALDTLRTFVLQHPGLRYAWLGTTTLYLQTPHLFDEDGVEDYNSIDVAGVAEQVRLMKDGGKVVKRSSDDYMTYTRTFEGTKAKIELSVPRKAVCRAVVVGQETVVHQPVPYQPGRTEQKDVIEWRCEPLLAQAEEGIEE